MQNTSTIATSESYISIKDSVLTLLKQELPYLRETFGVDEIGIFGSVIRGEDTSDSDIDILYTFQPGKSTLSNLTGLHDYLEEVFGRKVDLVSKKWISPILKPFIEQDAIICNPAESA